MGRIRSSRKEPVVFLKTRELTCWIFLLSPWSLSTHRRKGHQTGMAWFVLQKTWMVATQYISVCPSINPVFTRPIPHVRCYPKCKQKWKFTFLCYLSVTSVSNKDHMLVSFHSITWNMGTKSFSFSNITELRFSRVLKNTWQGWVLCYVNYLSVKS